MRLPVLTAVFNLLFLFPAASRTVKGPLPGLFPALPDLIPAHTNTRIPQPDSFPGTGAPPYELEAVLPDQAPAVNGQLHIRLHHESLPPGSTTLSLDIKLRKQTSSLPIHFQASLNDTITTLTVPVAHPKPWSAETPDLYEVHIRITGSDGKTRAESTQKLGFRRIAHPGQANTLNGHPLLLKGICRQQPAAPDSAGMGNGQSLPPGPDSLLNFIRLIKQFNINAMRLSDIRNENWYSLCDEYGIYLVKEDDGRPDDPAVILMENNHPSIIRWRHPSAGEPDLDYEDLYGNSLGGFSTYLAGLQASHPDFQGGFVRGLADHPTTPDGTPSPALYELKKCYQPIRTQLPPGLPGPIKIKVFNDYLFKDLSNISLDWEVLVNGKSRQKGSVPSLLVPAQQSSGLRLPIQITGVSRDEVLLNIRYRLKKKEDLAAAGTIVATEQLPLRKGNAGNPEVEPAGNLSFKDEGNTFSIQSPLADLQFDKQTGWLRHYVINGHSLLDEKPASTNDPASSSMDDTAPLQPDFWRAPTGLDRATGRAVSSAAWKAEGANARLQLFSTSTASDIVIVKADYSLPGTQCQLHIRYTVNAKGEMLVDQSMEADSLPAGTTDERNAPLPRFGMHWILPPGFDSVTWYGRGPSENYPDRNSGTETGIYRQTVREQFFPYALPQETGTRTDVHWCRITNTQGHGILVTSDSSLLGISVLHYSTGDLDTLPAPTIRTYTPAPRPQTYLHLDLAQMGLGGKHNYPPAVPPFPLLPRAAYHYQFKITPL